jgi:hypothetical protein
VAALESITLSATTIFGQQQPVATVRLTAPAPAGNASIQVDSNNETVVKVPANVSVAAGETTNAFTVDTSTVRTTTNVIITARYLGVAQQATLTVLPPPLEARFRVTSASRGEDACVIVDALGAVDCVFDASPSSGFASQYRWLIVVAGKESNVSQPEESPAFMPQFGCSFLGGGNISEGEVPMVVSLRLEDRNGNVSSITTRTIDLVPNGNCGY